MGFKVTTMHNVPVGILEYFIYVLEHSASHKYTDWFDANFEDVGKQLGNRSAIVQGYDANLTNEIFEFLCRNAENQSEAIAIEEALMGTVSLLISRGNLYQTEYPIVVIPLAKKADERAESEELMSEIMSDVLKHIHDDCIDELAKKLGGEEFKLKDARGGLFFSTLRYLNKVIQLKPNIVGLGADINAVLEPLLAKPREVA